MPRDNALFTLLRIITVCLRTVSLHLYMLWLTMIMQQPAIARRTIAVELLRRLNQMEGDKHRPHSESEPHSSADALSDAKQFILTLSDWRGCRPSTLTAQALLPLIKKDSRTEALVSRAAASHSRDGLQGTVANKLALHNAYALALIQVLNSTGSVQSHESRSVWTDTWPSAPRDLARLRRQAEQDSQRAGPTEAKTEPPLCTPKQAWLPDPYVDGYEYVATPQRELGRRPVTVGQEATDGASSVKNHHRTMWRSSPTNYNSTPQWTYFDSPGSDATFMEEYRSSPPLPGEWTIKLGGTFDGAKENEFDSLDCTLFDTPSTFGEPHYSQHHQDYSTDSVSGAVKTPSKSIRARSRTNGGLLEFRASAKKQNELKPVRGDRRNVSLNFPVKPQFSPSGGVEFDSPCPRSGRMLTTTYAPEDTDTTTLSKAEYDIRYKQRHTFVGTESLDNFIETLETTHEGTTSKLAVMKAYTMLACNEQILARQTSPSSTGWDAVSRITPEIAAFDYITLARVKLGSVTLQQFLDLIPFNQQDEVTVQAVVEAFIAASHKDAKSGTGTGSKARAFRQWMLKQKTY
jgi:hypothetical protein